MRVRASFCGLLGLLAACGPSDEVFVGELEASVVYGSDDRLEVYAHPNTALRSAAQESIVALIPTSRIQRIEEGGYGLVAFSLKDERGLCDDEPFGEQPVAASCSGTLIGDDLVLTAGHCISPSRPCTNFKYVFDYYLDAPNRLAAIDEEDVYECSQVVLELDSEGNGLTPDFAVVQLDRAVEGLRRPATFRADAPVAEGDSVAMIGFGSGLPAKIDAGAFVAEARTMQRGFFVVNLDAFEGHSGSAVFDAQSRLAGILLGGRVPDYVTSEVEGCARANVFDDAEAGEIAHDIASIIGPLCGEGLLDGEPCEPDACGGEPCGAPIDDDAGAGGSTGSRGVVAAEGTGCSATALGAHSHAGSWLLVLMVLAMARLRPPVV